MVAEDAPEPFHLRHRRILLAIAGGGFAALATPPTDMYPAMIVSLALLGWAVRDAPGFWRGCGLGLLWGATGQLLVMRFVPSVILLFTDLGPVVAWLSHLLLSFAQSLHWALGMGLTVVLLRRAKAPLELALGAGVLLALMIPSVFVWTPAGLLSPWPALLQTAEYFGERGVSVLFAVVAALLVRSALAYHEAGSAKHRAVGLPAAGAVGMLAIMVAHGAAVMSSIGADGASTRVAMIHATVSAKDRWKRKEWPRILSTLKVQTAAAETAGIDLSIWPEAAYPYPLPHDSRQAPRAKRQIIGGATRGPILIGFIAREGATKDENGALIRNSFNSATIVMSDGKMLPSYDKMELLWFGETVPLARQLPWLRRAFQRGGGMIPGNEVRPLTLSRGSKEALRIGMFNCYEDTLPAYGREVFAAVSPNLLVNITNDAWFVGTQEAWLHQRLAVMRTIELRRDMVRSVNLGVSSWIDAAGRVHASEEDDAPGYLLAQPTLRNSPPTIYARFGDYPMIVLLTLGLAYAWQRQRDATETDHPRS